MTIITLKKRPLMHLVGFSLNGCLFFGTYLLLGQMRSTQRLLRHISREKARKKKKEEEMGMEKEKEKLEGSSVVAQQNDKFDASMVNRISYDDKNGNSEIQELISDVVIEEKYKELLVQKHGPETASDEAFFDTDLWIQATGGANKGALYGQGSSGILKAPGRISITSSTVSSSSIESQQLLEERIRTKVREEMREEMDRQVEEKLAAVVEAKMKEHDEQMKKRDEKIDALMKALNVQID